MSERSITVTQASRSFSKLVSRVQSHRASLLVLRRGKPVVRIVPLALNSNTTEDLALAWPRLAHLTPEDAAQFGRDIEASRSALPPLKSAWD
jgi:prevent-host-death family protein